MSYPDLWVSRILIEIYSPDILDIFKHDIYDYYFKSLYLEHPASTEEMCISYAHYNVVRISQICISLLVKDCGFHWYNFKSEQRERLIGLAYIALYAFAKVSPDSHYFEASLDFMSEIIRDIGEAEGIDSSILEDIKTKTEEIHNGFWDVDLPVLGSVEVDPASPDQASLETDLTASPADLIENLSNKIY